MMDAAEDLNVRIAHHGTTTTLIGSLRGGDLLGWTTQRETTTYICLKTCG